MSIEAMKQALEALQHSVPKDTKQAREQFDAIQALRTALQQAEAQQPATGEPVGFTYRTEIEYADFTGRNGSFWRVPPDLDDEVVPLYDHPAPSVPADVVHLRNALILAASRLERLTLELKYDSQARACAIEWASDAMLAAKESK